MTKLQFILLGGIAIVTLGGAYSQGKITDRWSNEVSTRLEEFSARLDGVPTQIGNWTSRETDVDPGQFKASHCHDCISRVYENSAGDQVNVFLVSGKAIHVTQHSPDWCYVAAGYEMKKDPAPYSFVVDNVPRPEFLHADFERVTSTETTRLRILWTYSEEGQWSASKLATVDFSGKPALYKIYLIADQKGGALADDATVAFAKEFLPVINPILFPAEGEAEATESIETAEPAQG